ncbi:hypothetical protein HDU77_009173, partial [Chytriomyces hyalinus]
LTAEDAAKNWGLHVFLMVVELAAAIVLPELLVGAIASGIAAFAETVSAISTIATIGGRVAQAFKDLMQAIKSGVEGSALVARSRAFTAALLKNPPTWLVKLKTKVSKGWTSMRSTAKCVFTEEAISGLLPEPLGGGGLIGRDDVTVQELALMEPIITAAISNSSLGLERRANNDDHCILRADQQTSNWRDSSNTFRTNCNSSPQTVVCVKQGLVPEKTPDPYNAADYFTTYPNINQCPEYRRFIVGEERQTKWIPNGDIPDGETGTWDGYQLKRMCPGDAITGMGDGVTFGREVECDHKLELQEFRDVLMRDPVLMSNLGGLTPAQVDQWCQENRGLNDQIKRALNSQENLVYVDKDVNQAKGKMVINPPSADALQYLEGYKTKQTTLALSRYLQVVEDDRKEVARYLNGLIQSQLGPGQINDEIRRAASQMETKVSLNTSRMRFEALSFHFFTRKTGVYQKFRTAREETVDSRSLTQQLPQRSRNPPRRFGCDA